MITAQRDPGAEAPAASTPAQGGGWAAPAGRADGQAPFDEPEQEQERKGNRRENRSARGGRGGSWLRARWEHR